MCLDLQAYRHVQWLRFQQEKKEIQITQTPKGMGLSTPSSGGGGAAQSHPNQSSSASTTRTPLRTQHTLAAIPAHASSLINNACILLDLSLRLFFALWMYHIACICLTRKLFSRVQTRAHACAYLTGALPETNIGKAPRGFPCIMSSVRASYLLPRCSGNLGPTPCSAYRPQHSIWRPTGGA